MKEFFFKLIIVSLLLIFFPEKVFAKNYENYVTVVNPVRSPEKWVSFAAVQKQKEFLSSLHIPVTYLLAYGVLLEEKAVKIFQSLPENCELGIFLEVEEKLATASLVPYKVGEGDWARADKVFLSGYAPSERLRIIDEVFEKFRKIFGKYPVSVGAWYFDTFSLNYLKEKYNVMAVLEVSDQYMTDTYGVWGKPWGVPYYPSKINSLVPAQNEFEKLDLVEIQWALRDSIKGYGMTVFDSTFSLQTNDYVGYHYLDISYFETLAKDYLFSSNYLNQITIGLEMGEEGAKFFSDHQKEILLLKKWEEEGKLQFLTMKNFALRFRKKYPHLTPDFLITRQTKDKKIQSFWYMNNSYRIGLIKNGKRLILRDLRIYFLPYIFRDIVEQEKSKILKRVIPFLFSLEEKKEKILFEEISEIKLERQTEICQLEVLLENGENHFLKFTPDGIFIDGQNLLPRKKLIPKRSIFLKKIILALIHQQVHLPHQNKGNWCYSVISGTYYFGIFLPPYSFLGWKSKPPFFVKETFPFQVLARFKPLPSFSPFSFFTRNFINYVNHSTIKLISEVRL